MSNLLSARKSASLESLKAAAAQPNSHLRAHASPRQALAPHESAREPDSVIDLVFHNHGSVWLMEPRTPLADEWIADNIPEDAPMLGNNIAIEARYVPDVVIGAIKDGLSVDLFN